MMAHRSPRKRYLSAPALDRVQGWFARARAYLVAWLLFWNGGRMPTVADFLEITFWSMVGVGIAAAFLWLTAAIGGRL